MPEWLQQSFPHGLDVPLRVLFERLSVAFLLGCAVAGVYRWTHRRDAAYAPTFVTTLVLLTVLIAVVTQVIGESVARAFSLVGALSIVRFRTVVQDTRDTAFVIFAVIEGMAVGGGHLPAALAGFVVVGAAAAIVRPRSVAAVTGPAGWSLRLRVGLGCSPELLFRETFAKHLDGVDILAASTGRQGAALDLTYRVRPRPTCDLTVLVAELNRLEGVQAVELNQLDSLK
jgi:hypothetical protein